MWRGRASPKPSLKPHIVLSTRPNCRDRPKNFHCYLLYSLFHCAHLLPVRPPRELPPGGSPHDFRSVYLYTASTLDIGCSTPRVPQHHASSSSLAATLTQHQADLEIDQILSQDCPNGLPLLA